MPIGLLGSYMTQLRFEIKGNPSDEAEKLLLYLNANHSGAMGKLSTAVHISEAETEVGACLSSVENFVSGQSESVSIPVCGTKSQPAVYVHTQPLMKWKPSEKDIVHTAQRGELTRGFVVLTSNGMDSVFGSVTALPKEVTDRIADSDISGASLRSMLRDEGHMVKISSKNEPDTTQEAVELAVKTGLLDESYLDS